MSAMTSFTLRSLAKNRVRTAVTVAGVALAAALLTAVLTSVTSLNAYLYNTEVADNGIWTASVWVEDEDDLAQAAKSEHVDGMLVMRDVGFAAPDSENAQWLGSYLPVLSMEGDAQRICAIEPSEGRAPENAGELMLPLSLKGADAFGSTSIDVGATLTLNLGQRVEENTGTLLNSGDAYRDAQTDEAGRSESLVNVQARTYTVVGFYSTRNIASSTGSGYYAALTTGDESAARSANGVKAFVATSGLSSIEAIDEEMKALFPHSSAISHHDALLRYAGYASDRAVWDTVYQTAAVLAVVIAVSCVSLIYNAFAISVAERTRQFGLLSSIGASRKQIRRSVAFEAALVAVIGIPIGLAVGVGGTAVVLGVLGSSLESVLGVREGIGFGIAVEPSAIALSAALTALAVFASAWLPARRASSVSAVEAVRSTRDIRPAKDKTSERCAREPWRPHGFGIHRLFGISGQLAWANRKRGRGKGRAASISLALAVVLLMTAGSLTTTLTTLTNAVTSGSENCDISTYAYKTDKGLNASQVLSEYADLYESLTKVEGVHALGWFASASMPATVPADIAGTSLTERLKIAESSYEPSPCAKLEDGSAVGNLSICFIPDGEFKTYAQSVRVDAEAFFGDTPRAIAVRSVYGNNGTSYVYREMFAQAGTVGYIANATYEGKPVKTFSYGDTGSATTFSAVLAGENGDAYGSIVPFEQIELTTVPVEIVALADEAPAACPSPSSPTLVMPTSMAATLFSETDTISPYANMIARFDADEHVSATADLTQAMASFYGMSAGSTETVHSGFYVNDFVAVQEDYRMLATIVNVFSLLFTGILMLIAMGNVFNTVTNGLILRRREFAVMRSAGLGNRALASMITCECVGYGIRGLIPGVIASVIVSYLLFNAVASTSMQGLAFNLPWGHMTLAVALTVLVMVASTAYGLRRCRTDNVVEALRMDAA